MSELKLRPPKRRKRKAGPSAALGMTRAGEAQRVRDDQARAHLRGAGNGGQPGMAVPHCVEVWAAEHRPFEAQGKQECLCYS
jgi:hypothetical protein